jgi:hypothetical protein
MTCCTANALAVAHQLIRPPNPTNAGRSLPNVGTKAQTVHERELQLRRRPRHQGRDTATLLNPQKKLFNFRAAVRTKPRGLTRYSRP